MIEYGKCIYRPCNYCYPNGDPMPAPQCCKDTTQYYHKLKSFLNDFTQNKNILGNQFMPRSGSAGYPVLENYFGSIFYQGNCRLCRFRI
jgi:hypothetical protein